MELLTNSDLFSCSSCGRIETKQQLFNRTGQEFNQYQVPVGQMEETDNAESI